MAAEAGGWTSETPAPERTTDSRMIQNGDAVVAAPPPRGGVRGDQDSGLCPSAPERGAYVSASSTLRWVSA